MTLITPESIIFTVIAVLAFSGWMWIIFSLKNIRNSPSPFEVFKKNHFNEIFSKKGTYREGTFSEFEEFYNTHKYIFKTQPTYDDDGNSICLSSDRYNDFPQVYIGKHIIIFDYVKFYFIEIEELRKYYSWWNNIEAETKEKERLSNLPVRLTDSW